MNALQMVLSALSSLLFITIISSCLGQNGSTPLTIAAINGHSEIVTLLCQRGAKIDARDNVCMYTCMNVFMKMCTTVLFVFYIK
jgi:hypothetical protein